MPENNNNNASGSKIPASTEGLSRKGSVSPEDLRKYNLAPSENEVPANSASVVGKDVGTNSDFVNNVPRSNPNPTTPSQDENVDHLQASKQNDEMKAAAGVATGAAAGSAMNEQSKSDGGSTDTRINNNGDEGDKPWENTFDSDTDESGHVSRAVSKGKQRGNHTLVAILVIVLIALMFIPVAMYFFQGDGNDSNLNNGQTEQSVEKQDKDTTKKSSAKKKASTKKDSSKKKSSSSSKKKSSSKSNSDNGTVNENTDTDSSSNDSSNEAAQQSSASTGTSQQGESASTGTDSSATGQTSSQTTASTYTVKQGEGWYRAAVNSGMSTEQLRALNPGVSTLSPGTQLRIK